MSIETDNLELEINELRGLRETLLENIRIKDEIIKAQEGEIKLLLDTLQKVHDMVQAAKKLLDLGMRR